MPQEPYLKMTRPLYGPYSSREEAVAALETMTTEELQSFVVKNFWPRARIYQHGPEWTVTPMAWQDRNQVKYYDKEDGTHIADHIPNALSMTVCWGYLPWDKVKSEYIYPEGELERREYKMWNLAAHTVLEQSRTKEFAGATHFALD